MQIPNKTQEIKVLARLEAIKIIKKQLEEEGNQFLLNKLRTLEPGYSLPGSAPNN